VASTRPISIAVQLLEDRLAPASFTTLLDAQHADLRADYTGSWNFRVRNADANTFSATDSTMLYAGPPSLATPPSGAEWSFLGSSSPLYILPQTQNQSLLYLGASAEGTTGSSIASYQPNDSRVTTSQPWIRVDVTAVRGPGQFSIYQTNSSGVPVVWVATSDGLTANDLVYLPAGGHVHYNWAFTAPGVYEVDIRATAFLGANQTNPTTSATNTVYFAVDPAGPTNAVPGSQTSTGGSSIAFSGGTAITVSGPTTAPADIRVVASAPNGLLTAIAAGGATVAANGSSSITITGTIAAVNRTLDGLKYAPRPGFNGADTLTIATDDGGQYKPAPNNVQSDTDTIAIQVSGNSGTGGTTGPGGASGTTPGGGGSTATGATPTGTPGLVVNPDGSITRITKWVAVGGGAGGSPTVDIYDSITRIRQARFFAYDRSFAGGVRVAVGDVTGDGLPDIVTVAGPGGGPHVRVFDGNGFAPRLDFFAFEAEFIGGGTVAVGDVTGDGVADIVIGAGAGGGPRVRVFDGRTGQVLRDFFALDSEFRGGVNVATGRITGDLIDNIVVGAGDGGGPLVAIFSGRTGKLVRQFFAYDASFRGGVSVAVGDVFDSPTAEIVTGAGPGGGPHVKVFGARGNEYPSFMAPGSGSDGVRVALTDSDLDGQGDIVTASGLGSALRVRLYNAPSYSFADFNPFEGWTGGVFVGGIL